MTVAATVDATIVSFDIVDHSLETDHARQYDRIRGLNQVVRITLDRQRDARTIWASAGDGGHVAFLDADALPAVLHLLENLRQWAGADRTPMRIACHRGRVSTLEGADGREQLVGNGINLCASLSNFGPPDRVIATSDFKDYFMASRAIAPQLPALRFEDERVVYLKHFNVRTVCAVAFPTDPPQVWAVESSDHRLLREAERVENPWQLIYHMKRLFQVDYSEPRARRALNALQPKNLVCGSPPAPNALLGVLPRAALAKLLRAGELIERADGDFICQKSDGGDSMFIVLKGEIGVITRNERGQGGVDVPFDIRIGEGGIVGELALALSRPRTATLQAVGETALLAMNSNSLAELLMHEGPDSRLATTFKHFLEERIAEHLSRMASYLVLASSREEVEIDPEPWERLFDGVKRIVIEADEAHALGFGGRSDFKDNGLYILAGGRLAEVSENGVVPKVLAGDRFDIIFVRMPGYVMDVGHTFKVDVAGGERVTIIRLSDVALKEYARHHFQKLVENIRKRLSQQMFFDVFISYAAENFELALFWSNSFKAAGLSVYMNSPSAMVRFEPEIDLALSEARVLVPIISRAALESDWVQREINKRKAIFDDRHANILPIETEHRLAEKMGVGFTSIRTGQRGSAEEEAAVARAIEIVTGVTSGGSAIPFRSEKGR